MGDAALEFLVFGCKQLRACVFVILLFSAIFSLPRFAKRLPIPQFLVYPAIDPLDEKNRELAPEEVDGVLHRLGIPRDKPILLQVSRYDRFKDPI